MDETASWLRCISIDVDGICTTQTQKDNSPPSSGIRYEIDPKLKFYLAVGSYIILGSHDISATTDQVQWLPKHRMWKKAMSFFITRGRSQRLWKDVAHMHNEGGAMKTDFSSHSQASRPVDSL